MAEERLTLLMRSRGGRQARREVDDVADSVDRLGRNFKRGNDHVGMFSRGLRVLQTRMGMVAITAVALTVVLGPPLLGALALLTAGAVALGGALLPVGLLVAAAADRFSAMQGVAGSAANELAQVAQAFKFMWQQAMAPGADILLGAAASALNTLMPLAQELAPSFTLLARAVAAAMGAAAVGLAGLGPELIQMFRAAAPLIAQMGAFIPALTSALIHLAIAGMPVLAKLLEWLTSFSYWLGPALDDAVRFAHSAGFLSVVEQVWHAFASVVEYVAGLVANLATIAYELYLQLEPLLKIIGGGLLLAFQGLGAAIDFISGHMGFFGPLIIGALAFAAALGVMSFALGVVAAATALWNAILLINPVFLLIAAVVALGVVLYTLYHRVEWVRNAVDFLWNLLRHTPLVMLVTWLYKAVGGFSGVANAIRTGLSAALDFVRPKIAWLVDKIRWVIEQAGKVAGIIGDVGGAVGGAAGWVGDKFADGGVSRGGAALVGERGPEIVNLPRGSVVTPNHALVGGEVTVVSPLYLDGTKVAETVRRAAIRKKSTR